VSRRREARAIEADVCVIGAGAGGAVTAAELAEGGASVVVLEQGPRHDADRFSARPLDMLARLYRDGGQTTTLGTPPILLPLGRGLGGTTLVNSGTCFRTPSAVLERWRREFGLEALADEQALDPCFARVEQALSISEPTVKKHVGHILSKLRLQDRLQIGLYVARKWAAEAESSAQPEPSGKKNENLPMNSSDPTQPRVWFDSRSARLLSSKRADRARRFVMGSYGGLPTGTKRIPPD